MENAVISGRTTLLIHVSILPGPLHCDDDDLVPIPPTTTSRGSLKAYFSITSSWILPDISSYSSQPLEDSSIYHRGLAAEEGQTGASVGQMVVEIPGKWCTAGPRPSELRAAMTANVARMTPMPCTLSWTRSVASYASLRPLQ